MRLDPELKNWWFPYVHVQNLYQMPDLYFTNRNGYRLGGRFEMHQIRRALDGWMGNRSFFEFSDDTDHAMFLEDASGAS